MNSLVNAIVNEENKTLTENGDVTLKSTLNAVLDFFYQSGAARQLADDKIINLWTKAYREDSNLAVRALLYLRDIREGVGERKVTRTILRWLAANDQDTASRIIPKIVELGRWDDILEFLEGDEVVIDVFEAIFAALESDNAGLAAKWMPRKGLIAARIRGYRKMTEQAWRKLLVSKTNVVETQMCNKDWNNINYSAVPSVASGRYAKAFRRHDEEGYAAYLESVKTGKVNVKTGRVEKINTEALYPYSVIKMPVATAQAAWDNLRDFVGDESFIPVIDTSGSMTWTEVSPGSNLYPLDIAATLGVYTAERNKSAFKNLALTFASDPKWAKIDPTNSIHNRFAAIKNMETGYSTDFDKAMSAIVDLAVKNNVPKEDMPKFLLIFSDMQFNAQLGGDTASARTIKRFKDAGYDVPTIVWWNLNGSYENVPVSADASGMILVSGFSAALMQNLLSGEVTPVKMMLGTLNKERYDW